MMDKTLNITRQENALFITGISNEGRIEEIIYSDEIPKLLELVRKWVWDTVSGKNITC